MIKLYNRGIEKPSYIGFVCVWTRRDVTYLLVQLRNELHKVTGFSDSSEADIEGSASDSNETIEVIIITADNLVVALSPADTNNADGAASQTDISSEIADNDSEETQEERSAGT